MKTNIKDREQWLDEVLLKIFSEAYRRDQYNRLRASGTDDDTLLDAVTGHWIFYGYAERAYSYECRGRNRSARIKIEIKDGETYHYAAKDIIREARRLLRIPYALPAKKMPAQKAIDEGLFAL
jgi:hypothetical protein